MTLTADDLRRPAIKRIAHTITVLSTPVWVVPALVAMLCGAVAFVFTLIAMGTDWLMRQVMRPLEELKWRAAEAYVKRWPTPVNPADPLRQNVIYPAASGPTAKFRRYDTEPQPITPRPGDIDTRDSWGEFNPWQIAMGQGTPPALEGGNTRSMTGGIAHYACWQHPKNWSAPVPISEARKTDPAVEAFAQKIERGEVSLS